MTVPPQLLALLVCPRCKGELVWRDEPPALDCPQCRLRFPVRDGIPVMLLDEATAI